MWLLKLPARFLVRQSRWFVWLFSVGTGVLAYRFMQGRETLQIPGVSEPYVLSGYDPILAAGIIYFISSRILRRAVDGITGDMADGFQRLRSDRDQSDKQG